MLLFALQSYSGKIQKMQKLGADFYLRAEVDLIAKELLGKILVVSIGKQKRLARIVETEAYAGVIDAASHAYNNKAVKII
jgi:DNA-3-methyladenine glycosylase